MLSPQPPLFNCGSLMENHVLRVFMWILGVGALIGNAIVVYTRLRMKTTSRIQAVQNFFVVNLGFSDFLMGVYMLILASVDIYYGDEYFIYSEEWRSSPMCKFAGFICLLSSETSVLFLTVITFDRLIGAGFPLNRRKFSPRSAKITGCIVWLLTVSVSVIPIMTAGPDSDWYDLSDVCIGLPLITRPSSFVFQASGVGDDLSFDLPVAKDTKPAWFFSIALFLGVNLLCFIAMLVCYVILFIQVRRSRLQAGRTEGHDEEIRLAIRMSVIVGTDMLCWTPVIIMGILSQTGAIVIPLEAYIWSVVFILPINSSVNPYLYTLAALISGKEKTTDH